MSLPIYVDPKIEVGRMTSRGFQNADSYLVEKFIWDDGDFDQMGWHDATIHGIAFGPGEFELSMDIDYIFKWMHPPEGEEFFRFWVSPCTLVLHNVYDLHLDAALRGTTLSIADIHRTDSQRPRNAEFIGKEVEWLWTIECHDGDLSFRSVGFKQYVRRPPVLKQTQSLSLAEREGLSFARAEPEPKSS